MKNRYGLENYINQSKPLWLKALKFNFTYGKTLDGMISYISDYHRSLDIKHGYNIDSNVETI